MRVKTRSGEIEERSLRYVLEAVMRINHRNRQAMEIDAEEEITLALREDKLDQVLEEV